MRSTFRVFAVLGLAALTVGLMTVGASAQSETVTFEGDLTVVASNESNMEAEVLMTLDRSTNQLDVRIETAGDFFIAPHAQHIHGTIGESSTCPTLEQDNDGDGFVNTPEGQQTYGPILASLTTEGDTSPSSALAVKRFPTYEDGVYERTIELPEDVASNLSTLHVVIHGVDVNDNNQYDSEFNNGEPSPLSPEGMDIPAEATLPAVCGTLAATPSGGVQTGGGATAPTSTGSAALIALAAVGVFGLGAGLRRRFTA